MIDNQEDVLENDNSSIVLAIDEGNIDDFDDDLEFVLFTDKNKNEDILVASSIGDNDEDEDENIVVSSLIEEEDDDDMNEDIIVSSLIEDDDESISVEDEDEIVVSTFIGFDDEDIEENVNNIEEPVLFDFVDDKLSVFEKFVASDVDKEDTLPFDCKDYEEESYTSLENDSIVDNTIENDVFSLEQIAVIEDNCDTDSYIETNNDFCEISTNDKHTIINVSQNKNNKKPVVKSNKCYDYSNNDDFKNIVYKNKDKIIEVAIISTMVITVIYLLKNKKNKK